MSHAKRDNEPSESNLGSHAADPWLMTAGFDNAVKALRAHNDDLIRESRGFVTRSYGRQRRAVQSFMNLAGQMQHEGLTPQLGAAWLSWSRSNMELMLDQVTEQMTLASMAAQGWVEAVSAIRPAGDSAEATGDQAMTKRLTSAPRLAERDVRERSDEAA